MIRSMTGFGRAEHNADGVMISAEIRSVNSRFLDLKLKLPNILNEQEYAIRKLIQDAIARGRVQLTVHIDEPAARAKNLRINYTIAEKYVDIARELEKRFSLGDGLDTRGIMTMPDVLSFDDTGGGDSPLWKMARQTIIEAIDAHREMREREGKVIGADVTERLGTVRGHVTSIIAKAPESVSANTTRLREKIQKLLDKTEIDESRFTTEIALYADRVDITEECVRFNAHCDAFEQELAAPVTSGKKLSFLLQEMNRETNTIASKANNAEISQLAVLIKEEQEKMREQVENME